MRQLLADGGSPMFQDSTSRERANIFGPAFHFWPAINAEWKTWVVAESTTPPIVTAMGFCTNARRRAHLALDGHVSDSETSRGLRACLKRHAHDDDPKRRAASVSGILVGRATPTAVSTFIDAYRPNLTVVTVCYRVGQ